MKIFLDSADTEDIKEAVDLGIIDGVTTNPSLLAKNKEDFKTSVSNICKITKGHVSVEVTASDFHSIIKQGEKILEIADNIVIKIPITCDGIKACKYFSDKQVKVNMTLCFSINQALIVAKAGASYISPFLGRLEDNGQNGLELIANIKQAYSNYANFHTQILAASIRHPAHFWQIAMIGVDAITIPPKIVRQLIDHPLTIKGLEIFNRDWVNSGLTI